MQPADIRKHAVSQPATPVSGDVTQHVLHFTDPRQILTSLPLPIVISRVVDGKILLVSAACVKLFGTSEQTLCDRELGSLFSKLPQRRKLAKCLREHGSVDGVTVKSRREDGSDLWLSVWQQRFTCESQECILTILVDRSAAEAEQRLREQRDELQGLLELADHDRETIAYDIHDGVIQEMIGALMHVEAAIHAVEVEKADAVQQLLTVARLLRDGIAEARRLIDRVHPPDLEEGLAGALQTLVDKFATAALITIELEVRGTSVRLASKWEKAVYRMVQEALNNVRRHSRSRRARVELTQRAEALEIVIEDWGVGFNSSQISEKAFGLRGLRQRAELLGGRVAVNSTPGAGTRIEVELPLPREALVSEAQSSAASPRTART